MKCFMKENIMTKIEDPQIRERLRINSAISGKPLIGPKSVNIHVTSACSYKCEFCWYFSPLVKDQPKAKRLEYPVLEGVLEDCHSMSVDEINFEGGETTVYPFWKEAFKKVDDLGMRLIAYTHLDYHADAAALRALCYAQKLTVNFSAVTEASFKQVHGKQASMTRVLKNLDRLLSLRDKFGKPHFALSFVVYNYNYHELAGFLDMAHQRKVDQVIVRFLKPTEETKSLFFSKEQLEELRGIVDRALQKTYSYTHDLARLQQTLSQGKVFENALSLTHSPEHNDRLLLYDSTGGHTHCHMGWFYSHIDEKGRVVAPCDNVGVCVAGNVNERRFKDIWFDNDFLHATLKEASKGIQTSTGKWQECRYCSYVQVNKTLHEKILKIEGQKNP